jgi:hypothetical protein
MEGPLSVRLAVVTKGAELWQPPAAGSGGCGGNAAWHRPLLARLLRILILDLNLLLADLLGHLLLAGHGVLVEPHPLPWHHPLLHHRLLLAQHHLVLGLGELRAVGGRVDVGVGDRFTLNARLLPPHRDGLLHLLGGDVLAQPHPPPLPLGGADPQLLLRARHGVIGRRPRHLPSRPAAAGRVPPRGEVAADGVVVQAIVAPQPLLLGLRQVLVGVDPRGVLDQLLVVGHLDVVAGLGGLDQGHEAGLGAEQAGVDQRPLGLAGLVVQVDGVDGADAVAVPVD